MAEDAKKQAVAALRLTEVEKESTELMEARDRTCTEVQRLTEVAEKHETEIATFIELQATEEKKVTCLQNGKEMNREEMQRLTE